MADPDHTESQVEFGDTFAEILKVDDMRHTVQGVVLVPEVVDLQGDVISAEEIEKAAHEFMIWSRETRLQHVPGFVSGLHVVESSLTPMDMTIEKQSLPKGTWIVKMRVDNEELWKMIVSGELTGFSVGGRAQATAQAGAA